MADTSVWTAAVTVVGGAFAGFAAGAWKNRADYFAGVDAALLEQRQRAYKEAWSLTGIVSLWPRQRVTYEDLHTMSLQLRRWYFDEPSTAGMIMSSTAQRRYREAQAVVREVLEPRLAVIDGTLTLPEGSGDSDLAEVEFDRLQRAWSAFRTAMTEDLLSRRRVARWLPRH